MRCQLSSLTSRLKTSRRALCLAFLWLPCTVGSNAQDIFITEFMAVRSAEVLDNDGDDNDFIEIYNAGPEAKPLAGYFLSDDCADPFKWTFPTGVTIQSGRFLVVWASEKDRRDRCCALHTNFRLNGDGECLLLSDPDGEQVHSYGPYPNQQLGYTHGLDMSGVLSSDVRHYFSVPTPGFENVPGLPGISERPAFSEPAGAYPPGLSIDLSMEVEVEGTEIRYTLDESAPDENSPLYTGPIDVDGEVVVAARAFQPGLQPSKPVFSYYVILGADVLNFNSSIPLLVCSTLGQDVPRVCSSGRYTDGRLLLFKPGEDGRARLSNTVDLEHHVGYRRRGNPNVGCLREKFYFNIEFRDRENKDDDELLFDGWATHSDYAMFPPWNIDRAFMRNPIAYWMSRAVGRWAPHTEFVECFLHTPGQEELTMESYWGVYVLSERIERGVGRVDVHRLDPGDFEEPDITGGYILQRDRTKAGDVSIAAGGFGNIVFASPSDPTSRQRDYIRNYIDTAVASLHPGMGSQEDSDLIDVGSWIDYHILNWYPKEVDAFIFSAYMYKPRNGLLVMGPIWDYDRTMGPADDSRPADPVGWEAGGTGFFARSYSWYGHLFDNERPLGSSPWARAYRARWREMRAGPLHTEKINTQIDEWAALLQEPARRNLDRWPQVPPRFGSYQGEINHLKRWLAERASWIDSQFIAEPSFSHPGGEVEVGLRIRMSVEAGEIFYTLNGSDPMAGDSTPSAEALSYAGEDIVITENTRIRARAQIGPGLWSAISEVGYLIDPVFLAVTEIMFNPPIIEGGAYSSAVYEFLEVQNVGPRSVSLAGVILERPFFDFGSGDVRELGAGEYLVVVRNTEAFVERYGSEGIAISGAYSGALSNAGQNIRIVGPTDEFIMDFGYDRDWEPSTNRGGRSLVIRSPTAASSTWNDASSWRKSGEFGGSPGREDPLPSLRVPGDVNGNGDLEISDVSRFLFNLFGPDAPSFQPCESAQGNLEIQDTDGDGLLTVTDALRVLHFLYLAGPPPDKGHECTPIRGCPEICFQSDQ